MAGASLTLLTLFLLFLTDVQLPNFLMPGTDMEAQKWGEPARLCRMIVAAIPIGAVHSTVNLIEAPFAVSTA